MARSRKARSRKAPAKRSRDPLPSPPDPAPGPAPDPAPEDTRTAPSEKKEIQVVEFSLGAEHYAIDLFDVREVVESTTITALPNTPPYVRGIIDLRGEITTIIDLKHRLGIADSTATDKKASRIIVLDEKITRTKTGILVDDVTSVSTFGMDCVDRSSGNGGQSGSAILGVIKKKVNQKDSAASELLIWIDIKPLVQDIRR